MVRFHVDTLLVLSFRMGSLWLVRFSVPGYDEGAGGGGPASGVSKCLKFEQCVRLLWNFNMAMAPHTPELRCKFKIFPG